ncbi:Plexin-B [Dufourea novaeangliae]|uniref:Plexin-B n=1 Tax=Dufourea novaeangliae TaxID=178035 RepID=A0A154NYN3_DUFNO|nr:Plexin-B [Dufourea novaeangliae]
MLVFPGGETSTRMGSMVSHQRQLRLLLSILVLLSPRLPVRSTPADVVQKFHDPEVKHMNHLVVDKNTGRVYVGAVNRLYQLSPDLGLVVKEVTGPKGDSTACSMINCPRETPTRPVDNVNKALVIDYTTTRLISCGSVSQGTCQVRNLHNISDIVQEVKEAVVANNATASTVAFIAPGPPNPPVSQVMYVGVTFTGNSPYRSEVPAVSSRSLDSNRMLNIAEAAVTTGTRMYVNSLSRERYPINYVYGFSSGGFRDDQHYYSYTEIPINCTNDGVDYNLVQAAYVGKAGSVLAVELGITAQDDVLFAVFSEGDTLSSDVPKPHSALCVYSLKSIRRKFMTNIQKCFSGEGHRGLDYVSPSHKCILTAISHAEAILLVAKGNVCHCANQLRKQLSRGSSLSLRQYRAYGLEALEHGQLKGIASRGRKRSRGIGCCRTEYGEPRRERPRTRQSERKVEDRGSRKSLED